MIQYTCIIKPFKQFVNNHIAFLYNYLAKEVYVLLNNDSLDRNNLITYNNTHDDSNELPVFFRSACSKYPQESVSRPEGVFFHQILFVLDGEGIVKCNGKSHPLKKGSAFFAAKNHPVEYISTNNLMSAFMSANGQAADSVAKHYAPSGFVYYDSLSVEKYVSDLKALIHEYYHHNRDGLLSSITYSIMLSFFEEQNKKLSKFDEVVLYIEKNFSNKITLEELAQIGCVSVSKLCKDFKSTFNCTIFEYILNLRLSYARNLFLYNPKAMTKDVAFTCGFNDVSYFCRAFKAKFGETPSSLTK